MPNRVRNVLMVFVLAGMAAATGFCISRGTLPPADYTFINGSEVKSLDPHTVTGVPDHRIVEELFEGLCRWDPQTLQPGPGIAERWEVSPDGRNYRFYLRKNAHWSDGSPVTAHDFIWSFRRLLHPETAAQYAYELWYAENAERYTVSEVGVGDRVEIELFDRPEGALPHAAGKILKGKLMAIESARMPDERHSKYRKRFDKDAVYVVEIDGRQRRFHQSGGQGLERFKTLLIDFDTVGVHALDDYTIEFRLNHPVPYFVNLMGFYPMFPVHRRCVETYGWPDWIRPENLVSNGPFILQSRRVRDRIRLIKSETYWDRDRVKLNSIDALAVESETTALNLYLTGQTDAIADTVPMSVVRDLLASGRSDFKPEPYLGTYMFRLNVTRKPLDDVRVRQALSLAIDRREIVEHVTQGGQIPADSLVPPVLRRNVPYEAAHCDRENVVKARRLLAEAGFPGGEGFPKLAILFNPLELHSSIAQVIQSQWKENLGIGIELQQQEWGAYQSAQVRLDYDIARYGWIADYPDPATFLKMWVTGGGNNSTGWSNLEYDKLIEQAQDADQNSRLEIYHRAEQILMNELPIIPLYYYVSMGMTAPYVKGVYGNLQNLHPLKEVSIDWEEKRRFQPRGPFPLDHPSTAAAH
ncbi:MAG: peptide ABC transporter substrate-binding protein [Pirellulales bacterium]|nr:peptide ABC transporter substrate-binding protein [Pirellulales bacterium]